MLLQLGRSLPAPHREAILSSCKELGYAVRFLDEEQRLLPLEGRGAPGHRARLTDLTGVVRVVDKGEPHELALRNGDHAEDSMIPVGNARFGAGNLSLIAGPCAVEDEERLEEIARGVLRTGAWLLRAGAFKPRTSPYSFQGIGVEGLDILDRVKASTGIGVVTEVLDPRDVERVNETADMIQVGARNMANFPLLVELGQLSTPVLLKRGFGATVEELLGAAEYILAEGNRSVILCERGVRGFDSITRHILDVGAVAYLKKTTHLPVIVDPSHAAGRADLVRPLARAGIAAGADGLLVEVHPHPEEVHSDGAQAVSLSSFERIVEDVTTLAALDGRRLVRSGLPPSSRMHQDSNSPLDRPS